MNQYNGVNVNDDRDVDDFEGLLNGNDLHLSEFCPESILKMTFDEPQPVMDLELKFEYVKEVTMVFKVENEPDVESKMTEIVFKWKKNIMEKKCDE